MIDIDKITVATIFLFVDYLFENRNKIEDVISDFGKVETDNGFGTFLLKPKSSLFKVFWISVHNDEIKSIGFTGATFGLTIQQLVDNYPNHKIHYSRYDDLYEYHFYKSPIYNHTIMTIAKDEVIKDGKVLNNIDINWVTITIN